MNQDSINRDRLLEKVSANVEFLVEGQKNTINALVEHSKYDDRRFNTIDETLKALNKDSSLFYGKVYGGSMVLSVLATLLIRFFIKL